MKIPRTVWALGAVSLLMDLSSELVHSLLRFVRLARHKKSTIIQAVCVAAIFGALYFALGQAAWRQRALEGHDPVGDVDSVRRIQAHGVLPRVRGSSL